MNLLSNPKRDLLLEKSWSCVSLLLLFCSLCMLPAANADDRLDALLQTRESMQEHLSDEPRRLMHDVIHNEFAKGSLFKIVNPENSPSMPKYHSASYVIGANLIAFSFRPDEPIHVSISIQLLNKASGNVLLTSDRMMLLEKRIVESGLKMPKPEFDNSEYGKAIVLLSRLSAQTFEEKVRKMNLNGSEKLNSRQIDSKLQNAKGRRIASPF